MKRSRRRGNGGEGGQEEEEEEQDRRPPWFSQVLSFSNIILNKGLCFPDSTFMCGRPFKPYVVL